MPDPYTYEDNPFKTWEWYCDECAPQIFKVCRDTLSDKIRLSDAAVEIEDILCRANPMLIDYGHDDFRAISRLVWATNHLPVGPPKQYWLADSIHTKEPELRAIEERFHDEVLLEIKKALGYASVKPNTSKKSWWKIL